MARRNEVFKNTLRKMARFYLPGHFYFYIIGSRSITQRMKIQRIIAATGSKIINTFFMVSA